MMRSSIITSLLVFATSQVSAQVSFYANQSAPFTLVVKSHNSTLDGSALYPCHEGAAIEGLCLGPKIDSNSSLAAYTYNLNYSSQATPDPVLGITGLLTWELQAIGLNLSSPMQLSYNPTSNVAVPLFQPSDIGTLVGFDKDEKLFIPQYLDDTQLATAVVYDPKPIYRWAICKTYSGYYYTTLAWIMGSHSAQNPSCQRVNVVRQFV